MKISHKWLQTYFKKPLPSSDEVARLLTFHIFEVEGIEKKTNDDILDVKVLPDRASYCLSHEGIAQELAALIPDNEFIPRDIGYIEPSIDIGVAPVAIDATDVCSKFASINILGLSKKESPAWLKEKLEAIGQRSISLLVDLTNFVMFDIGRPLHVFDGQKVIGVITARYANEGEKISLLGGKEIVLNPKIVVLSDEEGALDIANIKGGTRAELDGFSTHGILVALNTSETYIRKTATQLNIKTDASKRFENGTDPVLLERAMTYFVTLLKKEDPDALFSNIASAGETKKVDKKIEVTSEYVSKRLGAPLDAEKIIRLLVSVKIEARREGMNIAVYPNSSRLDLNIPDDVVDEVGRLYGYEHVEGIVPQIDKAVANNKDISYRNIVRNFLVSRGFSEVQTYTLAPKGEEEIINPLSEDKKYLRTNLSEQIDEKLKSNIYYADLLGQNKIKVFEFGRVWKGGREFLSLCIGIAVKKAKKGERVNDEIKTVRDELFMHLGAKAEILCTVDDTGGIISKNLKSIGVTNNIDGIMEVDFEALIDDLGEPSGETRIPVSREVKKYKSPSPYPFMVRDIAVFVPGDKTNGEKVWHVIATHVGDLLVRHELFDVFEKTNKETGEIEKTSFAYRLVFQSYEKTLTDEEVNKVMERITMALADNKWEVR